MRFVTTLLPCILLATAPLSAAADPLADDWLHLPELDGPSDPELHRAVEWLIMGALPCVSSEPAKTVQCVYARIQEFVPYCQHLMCASIVHLSVRPGYRLGFDVDWYQGHAWATLPLAPPTMDDEGALLYLCVNLEGHCGRLV